MKVNVLEVHNVNEAFKEIWWKFRAYGVKEDSHNGPVIVMPGPFITTYTKPKQHVLFNPQRDANPVFHLMEAIWVFGGQNHVDFLLPFNARYSDYAEIDGTVHGAYGRRWLEHFSMNQVLLIIQLLKKDPNSRQAVLTMWDPVYDLTDYRLKDRPCNTHIYFDCRGGKVNMTVCCRSNDMLWGGYGANVVVFSMLQELIALGVGMPMGLYHQFSNNCHIYLENEMAKSFFDNPPMEKFDHYNDALWAQTLPLLQHGETVADFLEDCERFCKGLPVTNSFLSYVAVPLRAAYLGRKAGAKTSEWILHMNDVPKSLDWGISFIEWTARREKAIK